MISLLSAVALLRWVFPNELKVLFLFPPVAPSS